MNKAELLTDLTERPEVLRAQETGKQDWAGTTYAQNVVYFLKVGDAVSRHATILHVIDPDTENEAAYWDIKGNPIEAIARTAPPDPPVLNWWEEPAAVAYFAAELLKVVDVIGLTVVAVGYAADGQRFRPGRWLVTEDRGAYTKVEIDGASLEAETGSTR